MNRKRAILQAAKELFAEKGHPATSVQEIATRAGVSKGLLFYYFGDKWEILKEIADDVSAAYLGGLDDRLRVLERPKDRLEGLIRYHFDFVATHVTEVFFIYNNFTHKTEREYVTTMKLSALYGALFEKIRTTLEQGVASGDFRPVDAEKHAYVLIGSLHGIGRLRLFEYIKEYDVTNLLIEFFDAILTPEDDAPRCGA